MVLYLLIDPHITDLQVLNHVSSLHNIVCEEDITETQRLQLAEIKPQKEGTRNGDKYIP